MFNIHPSTPTLGFISLFYHERRGYLTRSTLLPVAPQTFYSTIRQVSFSENRGSYSALSLDSNFCFHAAYNTLNLGNNARIRFNNNSYVLDFSFYLNVLTIFSKLNRIPARQFSQRLCSMSMKGYFTQSSLLTKCIVGFSLFLSRKQPRITVWTSRLLTIFPAAISSK